MIPNRLIRQEMQKKIWWWRKTVVNGGGGGHAAVFYERYQNFEQLLTQSKRFYPIISKTLDILTPPPLW